ncbi:MAG TPA: hypothetical protein PK156_12770 [Polyangium sp.]|nr:hypothetical protein [Polyangium sp.]
MRILTKGPWTIVAPLWLLISLSCAGTPSDEMVNGEQSMTPDLWAAFGGSVQSKAGETYHAEDDVGVTYPPRIDPVIWLQHAKLAASDARSYAEFGISIALSGDTALVGAMVDNYRQGAAYLFTRSGGVWTEQQKLTASDGETDDEFGFSVALSGDTALVGAHQAGIGANIYQGSAYVFTRSGGVWTEQQKLTASDGAEGDFLGRAVALSGDTALVGADYDQIGANDLQGSAYVFTRSGGVWTEQQKLTASDGETDDLFGGSVALSGDTALVGAVYDDVGANIHQGSGYVFTRSGGVWTAQQKLTASDGAEYDDFGVSVALDGNTALVGAHQNDIAANFEFHEGAAYVFQVGTCVANSECTSGFCVDGVCCDTACGGSDTTDCQACTIAAGGMTNGTCSAASPGVVCRAAADVCDVEEVCDGLSMVCPADAFTTAGTVCRISLGECDVEEVCDGISDVCPNDTFALSGTLCRNALGACDIAESCNGQSADCPTDTYAANGTVCRSSAGACDIAESCNGQSADCPTDTYAANGTVCRSSAGACDIAESCNGQSAACPTDAYLPLGVTCRTSVDVCDRAEVCLGNAPTCPVDLKRPATDTCRPAANDCDVAEFCTGVADACASDMTQPNGTPCPGGVCLGGMCMNVGGAGGAGAGGVGGAGGAGGESTSPISGGESIHIDRGFCTYGPSPASSIPAWAFVCLALLGARRRQTMKSTHVTQHLAR